MNEKMDKTSPKPSTIHKTFSKQLSVQSSSSFQIASDLSLCHLDSLSSDSLNSAPLAQHEPVSEHSSLHPECSPPTLPPRSQVHSVRRLTELHPSASTSALTDRNSSATSSCSISRHSAHRHDADSRAVRSSCFIAQPSLPPPTLPAQSAAPRTTLPENTDVSARRHDLLLKLVGARVVRGPDWRWGRQGTLLYIHFVYRFTRSLSVVYLSFYLISLDLPANISKNDKIDNPAVCSY